MGAVPKAERNALIVVRWRGGLTLQAIGYEVGIKRERVRQIILRAAREASGLPVHKGGYERGREIFAAWKLEREKGRKKGTS